MLAGTVVNQALLTLGACAARVTVVCLLPTVSLSVVSATLQAPVVH